jgi:hypothetical protein
MTSDALASDEAAAILMVTAMRRINRRRELAYHSGLATRTFFRRSKPKSLEFCGTPIGGINSSATLLHDCGNTVMDNSPRLSRASY